MSPVGRHVCAAAAVLAGCAARPATLPESEGLRVLADALAESVLRAEPIASAGASPFVHIPFEMPEDRSGASLDVAAFAARLQERLIRSERVDVHGYGRSKADYRLVGELSGERRGGVLDCRASLRLVECRRDLVVWADEAEQALFLDRPDR